MKQNDTNMVERRRHHVPSNQAQNREFRDATQGLTRAQRQKVKRELEHMKKRGEDFDYHAIKEIADEIRRNNEKI